MKTAQNKTNGASKKPPTADKSLAPVGGVELSNGDFFTARGGMNEAIIAKINAYMGDFAT